MDESFMSRRTFLAATGGVIAAVATAQVVGAITYEAAEISPLVLSSDLYASPNPQRLVFAVAVGKKYDSRSAAKVQLTAPNSTQSVNLAAKLYRAGLPKGRGVYVCEPTLAVPGIWNAKLLTRGQKVPFVVQVADAPVGPPVGAAANRSPSPTAANALGVNPICTRQPPCPLHEISLDTVIGTGKPVAILFATPARCQSQYCGPVLGELLSIRKNYPDITFVHVEIYRSKRGVDLSPTVEAWGIESEPWLYTVDGRGIIVGRIDGAFGRDEMITQLNALS